MRGCEGNGRKDKSGSAAQKKDRGRHNEQPRSGTRPASVAHEPCSQVGSLPNRSEENTSELQSLMRISYAVFCLKKKTTLYVSLKQRKLNSANVDHHHHNT